MQPECAPCVREVNLAETFEQSRVKCAWARSLTYYAESHHGVSSAVFSQRYCTTCDASRSFQEEASQQLELHSARPALGYISSWPDPFPDSITLDRYQS